MPELNDPELDAFFEDFISSREIYKIHCDRSQWGNWKQKRKATYSGASENSRECFLEKISRGDIVIAQNVDNQAYTYGIGVVSEPHNPDLLVEDSVTTVEEAEFSLEVRWQEVASNGEVITSDTPEEFPTEDVTRISVSFFKELLNGLDNESYPPPLADLVNGLFDAAALGHLNQIISLHLPPDWQQTQKRKEIVENVIEIFLTDTDTEQPTEIRRRDAEDKARFYNDRNIEEIQRACGEKIWSRTARPADDYLYEYFDPAIERIEEAFTAGQPWETSYSTMGDANLFIMPVNDKWLPEFKRTVDKPLSIKHSPPGDLPANKDIRVWWTRGGQRNIAQFESLKENDIVLYYRDDAIIAGARVGAKYQGEEYGDYIWDSPDREFVYTIKEYTRVGIPKKELWDVLSYDDNFIPQGFIGVSPDRLDAIRHRDSNLWDYLTPYVVADLPEGISDVPDDEPVISIEEWLENTLSGDYDYFILKTGDEEYEDQPAESYHFRENIPGSRQLPDAGSDARFVYLENDIFYAVGAIGGIRSDLRDGTEHYFADVTEYHEIDPILRSEVEQHLSLDFPIQYGIISISETDYERILRGEESPPETNPTWTPPTDVFVDTDGVPDLGDLHFPDGIAGPQPLAHQVDDALRSGKHIILTGPPGSGKTEVAKAISKHYVGTDFELATATDDWSTFDTIGGYRPQHDQTLEFHPGIFLQRLLEPGDPPEAKNEWLIVDELNRADIDKAFGSLFSALTENTVTLPFENEAGPVTLVGDPTEMDETPLTSHHYYVPKSWRLIGTMNTRDKSSLYRMSYAFMRRFAFVSVPVPDVDGISSSLIASYDEVWGATDGLDINQQELFEETAGVWTAVQRRRPVGPSLIKDLLEHTRTQLQRGGMRNYTYPVRMYLIPQLEGLPPKSVGQTLLEIQGHLDEEVFDADLAEEYAEEYLGIQIDV